MQIEQAKITQWQLGLLLISFCLGDAVILSPGRVAENLAWLAILAGFGEGLLFISIFVALSKRFPEKNLVQICDLVYGPVIGKLIMFIYIWFFFNLGSLVLGIFGQYYSMTILLDTPNPLILSLIGMVSIMAVKKGVEVIVRTNQILLPIILLFIIINTLLLVSQFKFENLLPLFDVKLAKLLFASHHVAMYPFGEIVVFLMFFPYVRNSKKLSVVVPLALGFSAFLLAVVAFRNIGVLGVTLSRYTYPSFDVSKLINIGQLLTRLEVIIAVSLLLMGFTKLIVIFYGIAFGFAQSLGLKNYQPIVTPMGILLIIQAMLNFRNISEDILFFNLVWPFYSLPFQVGLPLLTLFIAFLRKLPKNKQAQSEATG